MVLVLLMTLFLSLISVGLWAYSHSLLTSAAAQAARYAANADITDPNAASLRASEIMSHSIAATVADTVVCTVPPAADPVMVEVHCSMAGPGIVALLDGVLPEISVTAHSLREQP